MRVGVVADLVAGENRSPDYRWVALDKASGNEDRDLEIVLLQKIEELGGSVGGRVAIKSDGDPGPGILNQLEDRRCHQRSRHKPRVRRA